METSKLQDKRKKNEWTEQLLSLHTPARTQPHRTRRHGCVYAFLLQDKACIQHGSWRWGEIQKETKNITTAVSPGVLPWGLAMTDGLPWSCHPISVPIAFQAALKKPILFPISPNPRPPSVLKVIESLFFSLLWKLFFRLIQDSLPWDATHHAQLWAISFLLTITLQT